MWRAQREKNGYPIFILSNNFNTDVALTYHDATKHSYASIRANPHSLDWANQPFPFKIYPSLTPLNLTSKLCQTRMAALSAIGEIVATQTEAQPDLKTVAQLLYLSAGVTRRRQYPGGEIYFRAAACTGALYEVELYVVCGDIKGLDAGVYQFSAADFSLRRLHSGDYRGALVEATAGEPAIAHAPLIIVSTCTYWRNAWKYQARTYRHFGWDNGTVLANLLAVATSFELPGKIIAGFKDADVNCLLDIDPMREVAFSLAALGHVSTLPPLSPSSSPLGLETVPISRYEVDYPVMREVHTASSLESSEEVETWRGHTPQSNLPPPAGVTIPIQPLADAEVPRDSIEQVILRRGSSRRFSRLPVSLAQLSTILERTTHGVSADFLDPPGAQLNQLYLIVHAVEGLDAGAYVFHRDLRVLECLKKGDFRIQAGYLGLEQELPADAAVDIFFLADLRLILERFGNRGYRAVQLEAGIVGGRVYLAAYAQRLGATGLTFYDDDVIQFFSPHAQGKSAVFLVAVGKSAKHLI